MTRSHAQRRLRQTILQITSAAGAALMALGCNVGPNYQQPQVAMKGAFGGSKPGATTEPTTRPLNSQITDAASPVAEWWTTLRDPELDRLIQRASVGNLNLARAASRIREARANLRFQGANLYPQVNADGGYNHARGSNNVVIPLGAFGAGGGSSGASTAAKNRSGIQPQQVSSSTNPPAGAAGGPLSPLGEGGLPGVTTDIYQVGFDATWEIDVFGGTRRNVEAAAAEQVANIEDRRDVLVSLVAEVARDYLQLRGLQQRLAIAERNLALQQDTLGLTKSRFNAGFVTDLDVYRAQTEVAQTQATIPPLKAGAQQMVHAISTLLGEEPDAFGEELTSAATPIPEVPPMVAVGLPAELLRRRPDIRRAERQIAAANARIGAATADLYPRFTITGQAGLDATKFKNTFDWSSRYFLLSPGVSWTILDFGRINANIDVQKEEHAQAMLTYRQQILTAMQEVEDALVNYQAEQARHAALTDAVSAAQSSVDIARQQYKQGVIDFLQVLDAQRALLQAQDQLVQSSQMITTDLVALYKSLGGGWEVDAASNKGAAVTAVSDNAGNQNAHQDASSASAANSSSTK